MKKIFILTTILLLACSGNKKTAIEEEQKNLNMDYETYDDYWKQISALEKKGLTKSAFDLVKKIYAKAKKEENAPQIIKSLLHQSKYMMRIEENAQIKILDNFNKEITENQRPTKNILESILAKMYWQYYQSNRWKFMNRTETAQKVDKNDFRTWDLKTIFKEIDFHFSKSLKNESLLQKMPISKFDAILKTEVKNRKYRPSLYDLLVHNALNFYQSNENALTRPSYKFEINQEKFLWDVNTFVKLKIDAKDTESLQLKALKLYQNWLKFKMDAGKTDALAVADLERINYVHQNAVFDSKEDAYINALRQFVKTYHKSDISAKAYFYMAQAINYEGNQYVSKQEKIFKWKKKEALELCNLAIKKFPKSEGALQCKQLKMQILNKRISIIMEKNIPENKYALVKINYANLKNLNFSLYKVKYENLKEISKVIDDTDRYKHITQLPLAKSWKTTLKNDGDHQSHSIEKIIPPLEFGQYILLVKPSESGKNTYGYTYFQVTNLALIHQEMGKDKDYYVINRNNGKPVANARINIKKRKREWVDYRNNIRTNYKGIFKFSSNERSYYYSYLFEIIHQGKKSYFEGNVRKSYPYQPIGINYQTYVFTDRSIYRPGQKVYFKTIALKQKKDESSIVQNQQLEATLFDVNNQKVGQLNLITNNYGSAQGSFLLPENTLTGNFYIVISGKNDSFRTSKGIKVENYKRPKFDVDFKPVTQSYKINDSIFIAGQGMSFAGTPITDAKVTYRVKRIVQMPRWWYWYRPHYNTEAQEIAHGTTKTDKKGTFIIDFKAIPDYKLKPESFPVFVYDIYAEVTDINGETHAANSRVSVGYQALIAKIEIPDKINKNTVSDSIHINITNLNGQEMPSQGTIKIYKLQAPSGILRTRPWAAPEYQEIDKNKFTQLFPHMPYDKNEADFHFWKKAKLLWNIKYNTEKTKKVSFGNKSTLPDGKYIAVLETLDKFGNKISDKTYFDIYSTGTKRIADNQFLSVFSNKKIFKPGNTLIFKIGSAAKDVYARIMVEKDHRIISNRLVKLNQNYQAVKVPVSNTDYGGFAVHYFISAHNEFKHGKVNIPVPYPKSQLQIETLAFRDKLLPGQNETWTFKIKGPKGEKVTSELLASMYDASLDQFIKHSWNFHPLWQPEYYSNFSINNFDSYAQDNFGISNLNKYIYYKRETTQYDQLNWFGFNFGILRYGNIVFKRQKSLGMEHPEAVNANAVDEVTVSGYSPEANSNVETKYSPKKEKKPLSKPKEKLQITARKNLQETAFFYPQLHTDKNGNISFSFTIPEALTKWKLQMLAYTKKLNYAYKELFSATQKNLMVFPNAPRFVREGDRLIFSSKVSNLTNKPGNGIAELELSDALTGKIITSKLLKNNNQQNFSLSAKGNTSVDWAIDVPDDIQAIQYKVMAKMGSQTDGEQNVWPVLSNRMLVTETMPMWVRSNQDKTFVMNRLKNNTSKSLKNHLLTLEITSNPAWYAIQALPYLMEYPYDCSEQTFSRYYANALATHIANSNPKIEQVFKQWKNKKALLSNLEKNQELKSMIIEETPWLRDAQSETEQKKRIALLFDLNKMAYELNSSILRLKEMQLSDGGFPWFKGSSHSSRHITQHIIGGFGHLRHLNISTNKSETQNMIVRAIKYLDNETKKDYDKLLKQAKKSKDEKKFLETYQPNYTIIHYLYMRSFYPEMKTDNTLQKILDYYRTQAQKYWLKNNIYTQALLALVSQRHGQKQLAEDIIRSLDENSVKNDELGMYWKENVVGWSWHQAPIETQALLIEAFDEITGNSEKLDEMRIWLLKHKQTNAWKTTKQTTEAVYALLLRGSSWLSLDKNVNVEIGRIKITPEKMPEIKTEAGTGYFKKTWKANEITPDMSQVKISKKGKGIAWGGLYWQYFENLDKIKHAETPLKLTKKLFIRKFSDAGEKLEKINTQSQLKIGDLVRVRIEIKVDRAMEYVHLKDMRASGFEPVNVLSQYKWQDGLGYYESTRDASTNFFISYLPKGIYVFEYDLRANNSGTFSNGITTIQSMYAPEFSSHSKGIKVDIKP